MKSISHRLMILAIVLTLSACDGILKNIDDPFQYEWTKTFGGSDSGNDNVLIYNTITDNSGNIYILGDFRGSADFDPGPGMDIKVSTGSYDGFLTMINANGIYGWTIVLHGKDAISGSSIYSCSTDYEKNIYIAGSFEGGVDFNFSSDIDIRTSAGYTDVFLMKISNTGKYNWTMVFGGTDYDYCTSVKTDNFQNIYLCGEFKGSVDFNPLSGIDIKTSHGDRDIFLTKVNTTGVYAWTMTFGGTTTDTPKGMSIDPTGNIYVTGEFTNTVDFNPYTGVDEKTSVGAHNIFLTKINENSNYGWTITFYSSDAIYGGNVSTDRNGNIYIIGQLRGSVDFNPYTEIDMITSNNLDFFLTKINNDSSYAWTSCFRTLSSWGHPYDQIFHISLINDITGNVYLCGKFTGVVDFNPSLKEDVQIAGTGWNLFCTRINQDGSYSWSMSINGLINYEVVSIDNNLNLYIAGFFSSYVDFNPGLKSGVIRSNGVSDGFLIKLHQPY